MEPRNLAWYHKVASQDKSFGAWPLCASGVLPPGFAFVFRSGRDWMPSARRICLKFWHALALHLPGQVLWPPFMVLITTGALRLGRTLVCRGITLTEANYGQRRGSWGPPFIASNESTQGRGFSGVLPPLCPSGIFSFLFISIMCRSSR